jgi:phenylalanine-4-hydroxylase
MVNTNLAPIVDSTKAEACLPARSDWLVDQKWSSYSVEDHHTWSILFERMTKKLDQKCSSLFIEGVQLLDLNPHQIPNFVQLSERLKPYTGFEVVGVSGLIPDDVFFNHLANRRFPAGCAIRKPNELDFAEEPDVFHDVYGHVPLLMIPEMADFMQACGKAAVAAHRKGTLDFIARLYWYIVEVGLLRENNKIVCFGAAINSSVNEVEFALNDQSPNRIIFDLERVMCSDFWIHDLQNTYFVLEGVDQLKEIANTDLDALISKLLDKPKINLGSVRDSDHILSLGSGSYHAQCNRLEELT